MLDVVFKVNAIRTVIRGKFVLKNPTDVMAEDVVITTTLPSENKFLKFKEMAVTSCTISTKMVITCKINIPAQSAATLIWRMDGVVQAASKYTATLKGTNVAEMKLNAVIA